MRRKLLGILVLLATAACAGGGFYYSTTRGREVVVVDTGGAPVAGALVVFQSISESQEPVTTGPDGRARLRDRLLTGQKWIVVTCQGYGKQRVDFPEDWPVEIVLEPAGASRPEGPGRRPRNVQIIPRQ